MKLPGCYELMYWMLCLSISVSLSGLKTDAHMWHWGSFTASSRGMTKLERCMKGDARRRKVKTHTFGRLAHDHFTTL